MLTTIAKRHEDWVRMVIDFGEERYPEDIVQEAYLKLNKYIERGTVREETLNTYFYCILKSIFIDLQRVRGKYGKVSLEDLGELTSKDHTEELGAIQSIYDKIEEEIKEWYWYDQEMFRLYVNTDLSQREIADMTNISLGSVHNTLRRCGDKIKHVIGEDYQDYNNKEYERIESVS